MIRNALITSLGVVVAISLIFVLLAMARDEHSRQLHTALEKYEQIKLLPKGEARSAQMKEWGLSLRPICEQIITTAEKAALCFSAASALLEAGEAKSAAELFARAAKSYDTEALRVLSLFMQAQSHEAAREFEKALSLYKELEPHFLAIKKSEIAIFHQARMLYYLGRYDEAEEKFAKISRESEGKEFAAASRNYISLLNAERAANR